MLHPDKHTCTPLALCTHTLMNTVYVQTYTCPKAVPSHPVSVSCTAILTLIRPNLCTHSHMCAHTGSARPPLHVLNPSTGAPSSKAKPPSPILRVTGTQGHSQQLEDFHVAAERAVGLGAQLDAQGAAGGADHEAVDEVGLAVVAHTGRQCWLGSAGVLHLHVDLAGGHDHRLEPRLGQCGFLRHQVRAGVQKAQR